MEKLNSEIVSFIRQLYKQPSNFIPLHSPVFFGNEKKYLNECIESTFVSSIGKFVDNFEEKIAEYTGAAKAIACVNGTNSLHIALLLVGVEKDTEVITQPLTFIATVNAIRYCNANPVFIDVDNDTLGLSPQKLEYWLKNNTTFDKNTNTLTNKLTNKQITACVPMHTYGLPCRIDEIVKVCNLYNIPVVEDAAEGLGSFYKKQHTGTFGEIGILSFNGNKIITSGGGGMMLFNDEKLAQKAKHLTTQAKVPHQWEFEHDEIGYNYRMPNINAALGLAQLEQLPKFIENKRNTAQSYAAYFNNIGIEFATELPESKANYWLNTIIFKDKLSRDSFLKYTNNNGVMTRPAWTLMNKLKIFKEYQTGDLSKAEWLKDRLVNIPSSQTENQL